VKPVNGVNSWTSRLRWLSYILVIALLVSLGLPIAMPSNLAQASPDSWTQTTVAHFNSGTPDQTRVDWDPGVPNDGDVILDSVPLDQQNWGYSENPNSPKIYGSRRQAQTFLAGKSGEYVTISLYFSKHENLTNATPISNLVVELRDCVIGDPLDPIGTAKPGTILDYKPIFSSTIGEAGGAYDVRMGPLSSPHISAGTMYAIVVRQDSDGGGSNDYYTWWYDGDYGDGKGYKVPPPGWGGGGFGNHDGTFKVYIGDSPGKGYYPSGTFTSSAKDTGGSAYFDTISWNANVPTDTSLEFQIRTAATEAGLTSADWHGPTGTSDNYTSTGPINSVHNGDQWIQYKAYLATSDSDQTPVLHDVTINYELNEPPVADPQSVTTDEDTAKVITLTGSDPESDPLTFIITSLATHGTLKDGVITTTTVPFTLSGANVTYTPDANYNGFDSFTFKVNDSTVDSNTTATVSITVNPINDKPVVGDIPDQTINEGESFTTFDLDDYVSDPDNTDAELIWGYSDNSELSVTIDTNHVVTIGIPDADWYGSETITFTATDPGSLSDSDDATFTVTSVNDPPVANNDSASTPEDTAVTIDVLANDSDADGDTLRVINLTQPSKGTATLNLDQTVTYIPDADFYGTDSFTYQANDTKADSNVATVNITVESVSAGATGAGRKPRTYFTVDFLGEITKELMSKSSGKLLDPLEAPSSDGIHVLELEEGTRTLDEDGAVVKLIEITQAGTPPPPENTVLVGQVYDFQPSGITFSKPIGLTLGYDVNDLPEDVASVALAYYTSKTGWVELEAESDVVAKVGRLSAPVEHFTLFAVLASVSPPAPAPSPPPPPAPVSPAAFELSNLFITPSISKVWEPLTFLVKTGEEVTISVDVTNYGGEEGSYEAILKISGVTQATKEITLGAGQHQKITFTVTENEPGLYVVQIGDLSGEFQSLSWFNWWLTGEFVVAFILLSWLAWYYWYYRKWKKHTS